MTASMTTINAALEDMFAEDMVRYWATGEWQLRNMLHASKGGANAASREEFVEQRVAEWREDRRLTREFGPVLGPGRAQLAGAQHRLAMRARLRSAVPGMRPGRFVRAAG